MLTREDLLHMRNMSFEDINPAEIPDLDQMDIDVTKSKKEKDSGHPGIGEESLFRKKWKYRCESRICFYKPYYRRSAGKPCADEVVIQRRKL